MIQSETSIFSLPLHSWQQTPSPRVRKYEVEDGHKVGRKRRRVDVDLTGDSDDPDAAESTAFESAPESSQSRAQSLVLSPEEVHQYRIAGLSLDQELPGGDFPHAAVKEARKTRRKSLAQRLQEQRPPIYLPGSHTKETTLHHRHLGVLITILHRCLLTGDFIRAGRAWGMLLHEKFGKDPVDIRHGGRWGIGAEILFRQSAAGTNSANNTNLVFTQPGFEAAKAYYERLIIQYPSRSARSTASTSLQFYPAMFSLWVYVVDYESRTAREALEDDDAYSERSAGPGSDSLEDEDDMPRSTSTVKRVAGVRRKELAAAQEIAARMDEIMVGPPYSDSPALLRLRGMVALWIGDLRISSLGHHDGEEGGDDEDAIGMTAGDVHTSRDAITKRLLATRDLNIALERRAAEGARANDFFERASARQQSASQVNEDN